MTNKKEIKIGNSRFLVIDLTEPLSEETEVYPGDPKPNKTVFSKIEENGYEHYVYSVGDHNFHPHGDAPKHQNQDMSKEGMEVYDLGYCFNSACLIDLEGKKVIRKEDLEPYTDIISKKGAIVIRTGYDRHLEANKPHKPEDLPYFDEEAADLIAGFKNLKVIGTDSITVDPAGVHYTHKRFKNLLIVEGMVHLYEIPTKEFYLQTSPVRIKGATGGPVVAYAFVGLGQNI